MILKKIIFYIPLIHYIIDILIFYFNYTTSIFNSSIKFINELNDYYDKFNLINIILTYCYNLKNIDKFYFFHIKLFIFYLNIIKK